MRKILLLPFMLLMALVAQAQATHLSIEKMSGAEELSALATIGKIVFDQKGLYLYDKTGAELGYTPFDQVSKIVFTSSTEPTAVRQEKRPAIQVSFNQETIFIRGIEGQQTVRIYNMSGQVLLSAVSQDGEAQLYVGGLQNGTYLLQVGAQVVKFLKR